MASPQDSCGKNYLSRFLKLEVKYKINKKIAVMTFHRVECTQLKSLCPLKEFSIKFNTPESTVRKLKV